MWVFIEYVIEYKSSYIVMGRASKFRARAALLGEPKPSPGRAEPRLRLDPSLLLHKENIEKICNRTTDKTHSIPFAYRDICPKPNCLTLASRICHIKSINHVIFK